MNGFQKLVYNQFLKKRKFELSPFYQAEFILMGEMIIHQDEHTVNLRLQYSSYFLFVMVITSVLYGMVKGKPHKNVKKVRTQDSVVECKGSLLRS